MTPPPTLLYDGLCGLCDATVQFVLAHDRVGTMRFATLQGTAGARLRAAHPGLAGVDSVMLLDADGVHVRSEAALRLGVYLGGPWRIAATMARWVPRPIRDAAYRLVARSRYAVFGRRETCRAPAPEARTRFLD
ncbi:MAG: DCC1-like thiol-disulfide oxidoreductase family protein [Gemmatimonadaceae bacterium]|nr:DCC1-like thiol-disulfide oxidoreductase family protein [Gemmatimonadaceae bacterium]